MSLGRESFAGEDHRRRLSAPQQVKPYAMFAVDVVRVTEDK